MPFALIALYKLNTRAYCYPPPHHAGPRSLQHPTFSISFSLSLPLYSYNTQLSYCFSFSVALSHCFPLLVLSLCSLGCLMAWGVLGTRENTKDGAAHFTSRSFLLFFCLPISLSLNAIQRGFIGMGNICLHCQSK